MTAGVRSDDARVAVKSVNPVTRASSCTRTWCQVGSPTRRRYDTQWNVCCSVNLHGSSPPPSPSIAAPSAVSVSRSAAPADQRMRAGRRTEVGWSLSLNFMSVIYTTACWRRSLFESPGSTEQWTKRIVDLLLSNVEVAWFVCWVTWRIAIHHTECDSKTALAWPSSSTSSSLHDIERFGRKLKFRGK